MSKRTTKRVKVELDLTFHGDYVAVDEIEGRINSWIDAGFNDRDDLRTWDARVRKVIEIQGDPDGYDGPSADGQPG